MVELWDLQNGKKLQTFTGHTGGVGSVACSADGRLILSGGSDNTVRLWDVASGKELKQLKSDDRQVRCVAFSPDSRRALSAGLDGPVHLWDLASGKEVCRMEGHTMGVNSVAFSPDGRRAVSGSDDTTVRLWQLPELGVAGGTRPRPTRSLSLITWRRAGRPAHLPHVRVSGLRIAGRARWMIAANPSGRSGRRSRIGTGSSSRIFMIFACSFLGKS